MDDLVGIIIQARMGSSRLPGKTMKNICGKPLLYYSVKRAMKSKYADTVIVATSNEKKDDVIESWCENNDVNYYRGSENDVLDRYYKCAKDEGLGIIVRVTADNPFIDPEIIDLLILTLKTKNINYVTMRNKTNTWPYGLDVEVFDIESLEKVWELAKKSDNREHVTTYIKENENKFQIEEIFIENELSNIRLTVDNEEDFYRSTILMEKLIDKIGIDFSWIDVVNEYRNI